MSNKLNTDATVRKFIRAKSVIMKKISVNSVNYFRGVVFDTEGAALGRRWDKTKKKGKRGGKKTLVARGRGKRSIQEVRNFRDSVIIAPSVKYMEYHQIGAGNNPVRQFMGSSAELNRQNVSIIKKELAKI